jgi:hypothetical protein
MNQEDYIKQLEASNQLLQQKLEETSVMLEESSIRNKALMYRPGRIWSLNGYKDFNSAHKYASYKNKPYPDNCVYPDYMYWTLETQRNTKANPDFCNHFIQQMRRYMGLPDTVTNCAESWLDNKIMDMSILVLHWYRVISMSHYIINGNINHKSPRFNPMAKRSYIIEKGNPQVYLHRGKGANPNIVPIIRMK